MKERVYTKRRVFHLEHVWYSTAEDKIYISYIGIKHGVPMADYFVDTLQKRVNRGDVYLGRLGAKSAFGA